MLELTCPFVGVSLTSIFELFLDVFSCWGGDVIGSVGNHFFSEVFFSEFFSIFFELLK